MSKLRLEGRVIPLTGATAMYKAMCAQKGKDGLTFCSIELRKSADPTEAIKGVARRVYDRVK